MLKKCQGLSNVLAEGEQKRGGLRALLPAGNGLRLIVGPGLPRCELVSRVPRGPEYDGIWPREA